MWVLINELGQVITSIPHGEIARQGGNFHVYVAFEKNYFKKFVGAALPLYSIANLCKWLEENVEATFSFKGIDRYCEAPERLYFEKLKDNENICSFKEKEFYVGYVFRGTTTDSEDYGYFNLNLRISKIETNAQDVVISQTTAIAGPIQVYVEETYGNAPIVTNITKDQVDLLLNYINSRKSLVYEIEDELFNTPHELALYCMNDLEPKNRKKIIYASINGEKAICTLSVLQNKFLIITTGGQVLVSDGENYYPFSTYDLQVISGNLKLKDIQLVVEDNSIVITNNLNVSTRIDLNKIDGVKGKSTGTLVGDLYLEEFAFEKQVEAMPHIGDEPPAYFNRELQTIWFDTSENQIQEEKAVQTFNLVRETPTTTAVEETEEVETEKIIIPTETEKVINTQTSSDETLVKTSTVEKLI